MLHALGAVLARRGAMFQTLGAVLARRGAMFQTRGARARTTWSNVPDPRSACSHGVEQCSTPSEQCSHDVEQCSRPSERVLARRGAMFQTLGAVLARRGAMFQTLGARARTTWSNAPDPRSTCSHDVEQCSTPSEHVLARCGAMLHAPRAGARTVRSVRDKTFGSNS